MRPFRKSMEIPSAAEALPRRSQPIPTPDTSLMIRLRIKPPASPLRLHLPPMSWMQRLKRVS